MDAGAVDSLLSRLATVLVSEAQLLGGLRGDVEFINDEMESMSGLLLHLTDSYDRDNQVRAWMKQVIGLSHDCEGNVELYVQYVGGGGARKGGVLGYLLRTLRFVRTVSARHRVATRIRELKVRARDVGDRRKRYGVTVPPAPARTVNDHPALQPGGPEEEEDLRRRELLYGEPPDTIEQDTNSLVEWIQHSDSKFKIIRIGGAGHVGKTTIARKVSEHPSLASFFHYTVWINNGGLNREYREVRKEILQQIQLQRRDEMYDLECLSYRRILVVIDDVDDHAPWSYTGTHLEEWEFPYNAVPLSVHLSGKLYREVIKGYTNRWVLIMTGGYFSDSLHTTRKLDTMELHCQTRPNFFRNKAFGLAKCEGSQIVAVLLKCCHDTFAAQLFLHLLYVNPQRSTTELQSICRALEENKNNTAKTMLMFCYSELPSHYKSCLMYLSIFPQGHSIRRTDLLRRWASEGLITKRSAGMGTTVDDQAERIFDSLVTRGFICPGETGASGKIKSFTVNRVVHDFIVTDVGFVDTSSRPELAHRFSINTRVAIQEEETLSESDPPGHGILAIIESLSESAQWEFLKVLDLQGCKGLKKKHLNNICKILLLKYLSLRNTDVAELPKKIEKLQCLQTLDIRQTIIRAFATKSVLLPMLKHLLAGNRGSPGNSPVDRFKKSFATVRLPKSIRRMEKLEVLSHVEVSNNDDLIDVGKMLHLRKLGVILEGDKQDDLGILFQQIEKLHGCLRSLSIQMNRQTESGGGLPQPPKYLQSLNISGITGGLHLWIAGHEQLTKITLSETDLGEDALRILGKLRILRCLRLRQKSYTKSELIFEKEEFKSLKSLVVECSNITSITFKAGAAPKLEMIAWSFVSMEILFGVSRLPKLKKLELSGDSCDIYPVKEAVRQHPNHPDLKYNVQHQRQDP
uniref:Uncharacterized protein n=1 Tax=Avena sativa TaxID=4498 RepID=A0ACD5VN79_AVESA